MTHFELESSLVRRLTELAECFDAPCVVNAPQIAQDLLAHNHPVAGFTDEDEYAELPGFRRWSVGQPVYIADSFDFVLLVAGDRRPAEVYSAMRVLAHFEFELPIVVVTQKANASRYEAAMERFDIATRESAGEWVVLANFELP